MIMLDVEALLTSRRTVRRVKVHFANYDFEYVPPHPLIRFGGNYLEIFGFRIGDQLEVQLESNIITITKVINAHSADHANKAR